jgi:phosphoribosylformylglycinamidine cyclo-ligase
MDYQQAGVNVEAGRAFVERIRACVNRTRRPEVLGGLGGFGGYFQLPGGYQEPILVSGTDGVGTKLKLAHILQRHDTVGIDLVAMCVNDVLTSGAEPLFFLDYLATGHLQPQQLAQVVEGVSAGCVQAGCSLLGGETAEMPGFYGAGEYDLAGFCVGIVEKRQLLDGSAVQVGDQVIGLASQGVHSNGFSLVRKIMADAPRTEGKGEGKGYDWSESPELLGGHSLAEVLLRPTQIYVKPILNLLKQELPIHGMAHVTGGGLPENLPRSLGANQSIQINMGSWPILPIFQWLQAAGAVPITDMFNTFNMGIGFALMVAPDAAAAVMAALATQGIHAYGIGEVVEGNGQLLGLPTD